MTKPPTKAWWKEAVIYQIYPASFLDSNNDGLGDIPGIISKLDYIQSVGVNAIWLSPIFKSPQHDMGYDISDYRKIHEPYGTVSDVEELIRGMHDRKIRVLLDLVLNHTSNEHAWFVESKGSRDSPKRDWYFWRDPKYDSSGTRKPPNNWSSLFGGSAWTWDEGSQQYYLSIFLPSQPDLNWENEEMRKATYSDMDFWLNKGVDGYRIDSMNLMSKHPDLPDGEVTDPNSEFQSGAKWFASGPRMHEYIQEMRSEVFDKYQYCMTVGELGFTNDEETVREYVDPSRKELNCLFAGDIVNMDFGPSLKYERGDFKLQKLKDITTMWQELMPRFEGWNTIYMENHDSGRSISRYASDLPQHRARAAKMLATYLCSLSGTLFLLQGQEIGMANMPREWGIDEYIDVEGLNYYNSILEQRGGEGAGMSDVLRELRLKARDNGRLPMQWDHSTNAGFSTSEKPWRRVNTDYGEWNVAAQDGIQGSVLEYWRSVLRVREKEKDVFVYGKFEMLESEENVFAYTMREFNGAKAALVILNFSTDENVFASQDGFEGWRKLIGENDSEVIGKEGISLKAYEGVIFCNWST